MTSAGILNCRPVRATRVPAISGVQPSLGWKSLPMPELRTACSCLLLLLLISGCESKPATRTLEGAISYAGKPLEHGMIMFQPGTGRPSGTGILPGGKYSVSLAPGDYSVFLNAPPKLPEGFKEGDPIPPPDPNALPAKFSRKETSGLSVKVEPGSGVQTVDFALE